MPSTSSQTVKLKSTLRLLIPRLRMAQKKDTAVSISARREMADLLAQSREASARIRVENIIHTDITVELMEILELYAELLLARAGLLDVRDKEGSSTGGGGVADNTGLEEAAASIIYAAPRLPREVRELGMVRALLVDRFGREFAQKANENRDDCVPKRVVDKLKVDPPPERLVTAYLEEIAKTYGVDWPPGRHEMNELEQEVDEEEVDDDDGGDSDGVGGGMKEQPILADTPSTDGPTTPAPKQKKPTQQPTKRQKLDLGRPFEREELNKATPPRGDVGPPGAKSPVSVAPPGARTDNLRPKVKLPGGETATSKTVSAAGAAASKNPGGIVGGAVPTVDDLAKRFQALKR